MLKAAKAAYARQTRKGNGLPNQEKRNEDIIAAYTSRNGTGPYPDCGFNR